MNGPRPGPYEAAEEPEPARENPILEFWRKLPALWRDIGLAAVIILLLMGVLWGFTGQPLLSQAPLVVVESGSMMHEDPRYGRFGTIDPGDLILVKAIDGPRDVVTMYGALDSSGADRVGSGSRDAYGALGDVLIYQPNDDPTRTPIIHRAITWVEVTVDGPSRCFSYHDAQGNWLSCQPTVNLPDIGIRNADSFPASGWVTKGDNTRTNNDADQVDIIEDRLVEPSWVIGQGRGEIPWIGLLKFIFQGNHVLVPVDIDGTPWCRVGLAQAPCDIFVMLWVTLGGLVLVPILFEVVAIVRYRARGDDDEFEDDEERLGRPPERNDPASQPGSSEGTRVARPPPVQPGGRAPPKRVVRKPPRE